MYSVDPSDESKHDQTPEHTAPGSPADKTLEAIHQVQPDSVPSIGGREASDYAHTFVHKNHEFDSSDLSRDHKIRIKFPKSNDAKTWKELNDRLADELPRSFDRRKIKFEDIDVLIEDFDDFIHGFFLKHCGPEDDPLPSQRPPVHAHGHRGLEKLRKQKNTCKKALKVLQKVGLGVSRAARHLKTFWFKLIQRHNKLRCKVYKRKSQWRKVQAERTFKRDPPQYAKNLFKGESLNGSPTFSKEEAEQYFSRLYEDDERSADFKPLDGMERPPLPQFPFFESPPTWKELKRHTRSKRNYACPGLNSLPYLIYKRCPAILSTVLLIFKRIFQRKTIPKDWAMAFVVLLQKALGVLDQPSEFRPIAITNTLGKIFFSIIADRLQQFLVKNKYIKTSIQKGFLFGVPGCVEHAFALWEALREAKDEARSFVISWLDLANAYGSVMHNLIQFALNWYHVPTGIQQLIYDYYEKLRAKVTTKEWVTSFFTFAIGLFQGCVLSSILFDCVFNLLLDFLAPLRHLGYEFKDIKLITMDRAYADDLSILTRDAAGHQRVLDRTDIWLDWTRTMRAKPKKCISFAMRQFRKGSTSSRGFMPVSDAIYAPYDPLVTIAGEPLNFLLSVKHDKFEFMKHHFKFLGRWIGPSLDELSTKRMFEENFFNWMNLIDKDHVNGLMKLWLYQHQVIPKAGWPLLAQDFNYHFVVKLQQRASVYLRGWAGLFKSADAGALYRPREKLGLNLTSLTVHYQKMRVIRCHLLKYSADDDMRIVYDGRVRRQQSHQTMWRDTNFFEKVEGMANHEARFQAAGSHDRRGLGHGLFTSNLEPDAEHRKRCVAAVQQLHTEEHVSHAAQLAMQSVWTHWTDHSMPFDLSWRNLIYGPGPRIISFVLNATINSLPTPDMLRLMGLSPVGSCGLCGAAQCTLFHILSGCKEALVSKRYTWRHDSVLATMLQQLVPVLIRHNSKPVSTRPAHVAFVKPGKKPIEDRFKRHRQTSKCLLTPANDWQLLIDFDKNRMLFPTLIADTNERPDIVVWSTTAKIVILGELTCPAEENISAANARKLERYVRLCEKIRENGWTAIERTIEAGARGFVGHRFRSFFRELGFSSQEATIACKDISLVTAKCSYGIWLGRKSKSWNASMDLVVPHSRHYLVPPPTSTPAPLLANQPMGGNSAWHLLLGSQAVSNH